MTGERFSVDIVGQYANPHVACFDDFARALRGTLVDIGHEVVPERAPPPQNGWMSLKYDPRHHRHVVLGAENLTDPGALPADTIIYNPEQVSADWVTWPLMKHLPVYRDRGMVVWDYSQRNVDWLRERGVRAVHCPVGFHPSMVRDWPAVEQDVDVLFYGSVNARRREILDAVHKSGLKLKVLFGVYGEERDAWIARSKVVLNLHFYERPVFEIFRVSHLLANKKCVVSEDGGCDPELEDFARQVTICKPRGEIAEACKFMAGDDQAREIFAAARSTIFKNSTSLIENVRRALEESACQ